MAENILAHISGTQIFQNLQNPALSRTTSHGILALCQNLEKLMTQFQENVQTDRRTEGQLEVPTDHMLSDPSDYHQGSKNGFF